MRAADVTADDVRRALSYDPETGVFVRKETGRSSGYGVGAVVGTKDENGYLKVWHAGRLWRAHRLAWLYMTGEWPRHEVDHINGNRADNRMQNLRCVDHETNMENQRTARQDNKSKFLGVTWHKQPGKWRARITLRGKQTHLGHFPTPEAAHERYLEVKRQMHEGCTI
jgi:hypothetical protein